MTTEEHADVQPIEASPDGRRPIWLVVVAAVVVIGLIAAVAIIASGEDDGDDNADDAGAQVQPGTESVDEGGDDGGEVVDSPANVGETRPIVFTGEPLPPLDEGADPAIGTVAPTIEGEGFDGSAITVGGASSSPTMVVYVAHWCPACNEEIPELVSLAESGALPDDLNVVAVSTAVREGEANYPPSQWLADFGWPWPVLADDPDATAFLVSGGSSFPYLVLLDSDGTVLARSSGARSADEIAAWVNDSLG